MNPPHRGHAQLLRQAKVRLEAAGYQVWAAWISPSHDGYVGPKAVSKRTVRLGGSVNCVGQVFFQASSHGQAPERGLDQHKIGPFWASDRLFQGRKGWKRGENKAPEQPAAALPGSPHGLGRPVRGRGPVGGYGHGPLARLPAGGRRVATCPGC